MHSGNNNILMQKVGFACPKIFQNVPILVVIYSCVVHQILFDLHKY